MCISTEGDRHLPGFYKDYDQYVASLQSKGLWELILHEKKDGYYADSNKTYEGLINVWNVTKG